MHRPISAPPNRLINAFTVDVEEHFQVDAFSDQIDRRDWFKYDSRVVANTRRILRLLADGGVRATFFVLGCVARQHPNLVGEILREGHEIGCHGHWHQPVYRTSPDQFREDLRLATDVLTDQSGRPITAFRAPNFSIRRDTLWALDVLCEFGYRIDSSIFPVVHDQYGFPDAERGPHRLELEAASLWEFPPSVYRCPAGNVPIAGGGYFRLFPFGLSRWLVQRMQRRDGFPLMFYIHPWEIDVDQPRLPGRWKSRWRHYQNLGTTETKLKRLLQTFRFGTVTDSLASAGVGFDPPAAADRPAADTAAVSVSAPEPVMSAGNGLLERAPP